MDAPLRAFAVALPVSRIPAATTTSGQRVSRPARVLPHSGAHSETFWQPAVGVAPAAALAAAAFLAKGPRRSRASASRRGGRLCLRAGFGPVPYDTQQREEGITDEVGKRVAYVVKEEGKALAMQLDQYGYAVVNGFLGGSIHGLPNQMREEMDKLFSRGWFEEESESDRVFKIGPYQITNQDVPHRFRANLLGVSDAKEEQHVETQYDVAPTVVNFTRGLLKTLAVPMGRAAGGRFSTNVGRAEMFCLCGNGARYDRRVSNVHGWNTQRGFVPDNRKLCVFYFANPNWREELGGHLQLEGVITPTGAVSIAPMHDRLVLFWADRTVWSMRSSQAHTMSEHHFGIMMQMLAENNSLIDYDPHRFARWFPELRGKPMGEPRGLPAYPGR